MSRHFSRKVKRGILNWCPICKKYIRAISGFSLATCREKGLIHDFLPKEIAPEYKLTASLNDLALAPSSLPLEETIQVLGEIQRE